MKKREFEYNYFESYYVCLTCYERPKTLIKNCGECKGALQRIKDPYDN